MKFETIATSDKREKADLIIFPFFKGKKRAEPCAAASDLNEVIKLVVEAGDFTGKKEETLLAYLSNKKEKRLLFLGLGEEKELTLETLRRSFAAALKRCRGKNWLRVNVVLPKLNKWEGDEVLRAVSEGIALCFYLFEGWKSKENQKPFHVKTFALIGTKNKKAAEKVKAILTGVNLARDLINGNALDVTPQHLADEARKLARRHPMIKVTVLNKKQIEKEKMGLLLAVASGSSVDPALITLEYRGNPKSDDLTMVVGKGVTFDTGGLNLKPTNFIEDMRGDMSGAAAALGVIQAAAEIKLKTNIVAIIPSTENAIDALSYKPGDVYRSYLGKTVEITNTDAEGRLILADALAYGQSRFAPTRIIDLATLTGAAVVALGTCRAALFCNHEKLAALCERAGEETGELVWRMPLDSDYKTMLDSNIADMKNSSGKRAAGSITAAMFLQEFIQKNTPWIHLDIAGTAFLDHSEHYHLTLATGSGVRLIINLLEKLS